MALPLARTRDEAHLYLDLHPCPTCGRVDVAWDSALTSDDGEPARRYSGSCPGCGRQREFVFRLPERPLLPGAGDTVLFGADRPSELLDAGEWLYVADLCAQAAETPGGGAPSALDPKARESLAIAVAALAEVLKFIPGDGDEVPAAAFWSDRGRTVRDLGPDRFRRRRLTLVQDAYRHALERA